jgi:DNA-binding LacI/PurR family transcriptional regulator/anti-anti-sigma regulatory factor/putative methionine-R-sulfoxide reductase with GAF domain
MPTASAGRNVLGSRLQASRPTIGLLLGHLDEPYQAGVWAGIADMAEEEGVNLLCFAGEVLASPYGFEVHSNLLYDLVGTETTDGLILMSGSLGSFIGLHEMTLFCERYRPLPMVSIALPLQGIPSVLIDNYKGMHDIVAHLLDVHGYKRVAFVRGPAGHGEADERYRAYVDVLAEHGLKSTPALVFQGDLRPESGEEAVHTLLDERKVEMDALVCINDRVALGAVQALQERGLRVPYDIAVTGFDDIEDARVEIPPLTTVRQPLYQQGRSAVRMLLAQLRGERYPPEKPLQTELVVRQSCGCLLEEVAQIAIGAGKKDGQDLETILERHRERVLAEMIRAAAAFGPNPGEMLFPHWAERLLDAFATETGGQEGGAFIPALDEVMRQTAAMGVDVSLWQGVLSALRHQIVPHLAPEFLIRAENLLQQGRVLVGGMAQRLQAQQRLRTEQLAQRLRQLSQMMSTTIDIDELMAMLARELPRLGIEQGYLSRFEGEDRPGQLRLLVAYGPQGLLETSAEEELFPAQQLIPANLWPREDRYSFAVLPLLFRDHRIGLVLLQLASRQGIMYSALRDQISSALWGALLFRERGTLLAHLESQALQLRTAAEVAQAASSVLDLPVLLQRVVDLVVERFGLYYAGLVLVEPDGRFATLQAGTGAAGRQLVVQGLRLEVGGQSMVGWCLANKQPRVAADVTADPTYMAVSLLPETRSEMVVPLRIGDRAIGALDVQSRRANAFAEDEMLVFQTMADQLAVAIENARIVAEMRGLNENLQRTLETQARLMETIEALSTPVVPLMHGVILLPLVGNIDSGRSQQVMEHLLAGVQEYRAQVAIVDITGVPVVDTGVANSLLHAARAVGLLGAAVVLVGIRPEVAQTMVTLGVDLAGVATHSNLQSGIAYALWKLGFQIARR